MSAIGDFIGKVYNGEKTDLAVVDTPRKYLKTTVALLAIAGLAFYYRAQLPTSFDEARKFTWKK
jgi:lysozyme family protein